MADYAVLTDRPTVKQERWREDSMNYTVSTSIVKIRCRWKPVVEVQTLQLVKDFGEINTYDGSFEAYIAEQRKIRGVPVGAIFTERREEKVDAKHLLVMTWSWYKVTM